MTDLSKATINGISVPDSRLDRAITEFIRDTESELLFHHSSRVYFFGALAGQQRGLTFNAELLYAATMFHDIGLMPSHSSPDLRFEVDGANAARDFLQGHGLSAELQLDRIRRFGDASSEEPDLSARRRDRDEQS